MALPDEAALEAYARRIKRAWSGPAYRRLRAELRAEADRGLAALTGLSMHNSEVVRVWAGGVARKDLGPDAIPLLSAMARHPRTFTRDAAMQELEAIDPELLRPFIPEMRRMFRRSKDLYSPGGAAMWRLARLGDRESAPSLRAYAARHEPGTYDHHMPLVLADYLDDDSALVRRIEAHDHASITWLARAVALLDLPGGEEALQAAGAKLEDECREVCRAELKTLIHYREQPPGADYET